MKELKKKENIIKLILITNLIFMIINIIKQSLTTSPYFNWILIIILFVLNIFLIIKTNHNNCKRNFILVICLIVLSLIVPVIYNQTYQKYEEKREINNGMVISVIRSDGGVYRIEHFINIYGIDIYKINHKPNKSVKDVN